MFWDYTSNQHWLDEQEELQKLRFYDEITLVKLRDFLVKTIDRIVDPSQKEPIIKNLFQIKHFFCKIPADNASLGFI